MKNFVKNLALSALILAIAAPSFAAKKAPKVKTNKDGTVDIELWYGMSMSEAGAPPSDWIAYKIIKDKLKINLKATGLPSSEKDQDQKINAAGAANALPDIFMVSSSVYPKLVQQKLLAPVEDRYAMMPARTAKLYDKDAQAFPLQSDGKSYALAQPGSIVRNESILIRKDWLDKLGLSIPKTTDEFLAVMKAFTERDPDGNGKKDTYGYGAFLEASPANETPGRRFDPLMGAFGVPGTWNLSSVKTAGLNINKPEYYDALVYVKSIIDAGYIDPNWMAYQKDDYRAAWKQGKFGIMREQNAAYASEANYAPFDNNFPNGEWKIINPPVGPKGYSSNGTYSQAYRMYAISAKAEKAGKKPYIAKLLEWMSSDEGYYLLGWGVEGVNYKKNAQGVPVVDGIPDAKLGFTKPAALPLTQMRNMVYYNGDIELAARYPTYKTAKSGKTMSSLVALREMQATPWTACIGQDKMPVPNADLERFYQQGVIEFLTGKRVLNPENWKAWLAEFNKMGGQAWEAEGIKLAKEMRLIK